jgi:hypothetical protein
MEVNLSTLFHYFFGNDWLHSSIPHPCAQSGFKRLPLCNAVIAILISITWSRDLKMVTPRAQQRIMWHGSANQRVRQICDIIKYAHYKTHEFCPNPRMSSAFSEGWVTETKMWPTKFPFRCNKPCVNWSSSIWDINIYRCPFMYILYNRVYEGKNR